MNDMKREEIYSNVEVHDVSISPFPGPQVRPERIYRCHAKAIMEYDGLYDYATLTHTHAHLYYIITIMYTRSIIK